jgi:hypothetical protein
MPVDLNSFQIDLASSLSAMLDKYAAEDIETATEFGPEEAFIKVTLKPKQISFYIYDDGAGFWGEGIDQRFERPDYKDLAELGRAFLDAAAKVI